MKDWEKAINLCEEIISLLDDLPEKAEDFGYSIEEKVENIQMWIEQNAHVTPSQFDALDNMLSGVNKWLEEK